jgi:hypothetical protein
MASLRAISIVGASAFALGFIVLVARPDAVERRAHEYLVEEVTARASAMLSAADSAREDGILGALSARFSAQADSLRARLDEGLAERVAEILAGACHYCEPEETSAVVAEVVEDRVSVLQRAAEVTAAWAQNRYSESVTALVRDLRIFTGLNAGLFLLVLGASFAPRSTSRRAHVLTLGLMVTATAAAIFGYVFVQDWFYAFVTGEYVGFGYALWVAVVFLALVDWVVNRGRVSQAIAHVFGAAASGVS